MKSKKKNEMTRIHCNLQLVSTHLSDFCSQMSLAVVTLKHFNDRGTNKHCE